MRGFERAKKRPLFQKAALLQFFPAGFYAVGGVGGVGGFFSRCGARSTWLALCQARTFSGSPGFDLPAPGCVAHAACVRFAFTKSTARTR